MGLHRERPRPDEAETDRDLDRITPTERRHDHDTNYVPERSSRLYGAGMSAIDNEIVALFNALNPTRQGQLLDLLGALTEEQKQEQPGENDQKTTGSAGQGLAY